MKWKRIVFGVAAGILMAGGNAAQAQLECNDQCEADGEVVFQDCVAALGDNPSNDQIDVCEDEGRAVRNACAADCPSHRACCSQCGHDARQKFGDCIALFGDDLTKEDKEACKDGARASRDACRALCPTDCLDDGNDHGHHRGRGRGRGRGHGRSGDDNRGGECNDQCEADGDVVFQDCVAGLGDDPTDDEIDVCEDDGRAVRDACSADCPSRRDCCSQCGHDARQEFDDCVAAFGDDLTDEDEDVCKDDARASRNACRALCPSECQNRGRHRGRGRGRGRGHGHGHGGSDDGDSGGGCRDACEAAGEVVFQDCVAGLGDNPSNDQVDVCEDEGRAVRHACAADCPRHQRGCCSQCGHDARQEFDDCVYAFGDDLTREDKRACKDDARASRDACREACPVDCDDDHGDDDDGDDDDENECHDVCEAEGEVVFQDCVAGLGDSPTNDQIDVCEDEGRVTREECNQGCD